MDEDDKKFPRKAGHKPSGARSRPADAGKGGKPAFATRKKSFAKRDGEAGAAERPKRDFKGGDKPFNKGPRPQGKPYGKPDGPRKPYAPRTERPAAEGERPAPDFKRAYKPRDTADGGGAPRGDKRPGRFERGDRPAQGGEKRFDRPKRAFDEARPKGGPGAFKPRPRPVEAPAETGERIAKRLARVGIASRRDAEELIAAGRVKVNGKPLTSPAFNVQPDDLIELDGISIPPVERTRLFLFHKPAGVVTTNRDPQGRRTVFDVLPRELPRLITVGRLDINTEGLLLLTNDGGLARVLELPATGWLRRYRARVHGKVEQRMLADLKDGIAVDGVFYGGVEASLDREQGANAWLTIGLREGKNREVKNILGALGLDVTRLIRISYGPFQLSDLAEGQVLEIKGRTLRDQLGERLIEEAGANFEADIAKPFSNKPVRREAAPAQPEATPRPRPARDNERVRIGEGGLIKNRKRRENSRDEALGKLSTRPQRGFGGAGGSSRDKGGRREQPPIEAPGSRRVNVWMAPGARPRSAGEGKTDARRSDEAGKGGAAQKGRPPGSSERTRRPAAGRPGPSVGKGKPHNPKKR
jgi:23S rRNA pseudouridine2605 synthase